ncbi:MAG: hypothetical protein COA60_001190 [Robiginitomaculum sp.]|nr:hypothetical protein [Robiginitomaculum sp.]
MALVANDANDRAIQMISLSERLTGLLQQETDLFLARTPQKAANFAKEKNSLARIYRNEINRIRDNSELLSGVDEHLKADLRAVTITFNQALAENNKANAVIRTITEGMVKSVATEIAQTRAAKSGYGADGSNNSNAATMSAITLDQRA